MHYHLTTFIKGEKTEIVRFEKELSGHSSREFMLMASSNNCRLFSFANPACLISDEGMEQDIPNVYIGKITEEDTSEPGDIIKTFHIQLESTKTKDADNSSGLKITSDSKEFFLSYSSEAHQKTVSRYRLLFSITVNNSTYKSEMIFCVIPNKWVVNVVLDFGSESSQMYIGPEVFNLRNTGTQNLLENIVAKFIDSGVEDFKNIPPEGFHQYDPDYFSSLFRSVFFEKKGLRAEDFTQEDILASPWESNEKLKFLSLRKKDDEILKEYDQLSNMKISYLTSTDYSRANLIVKLHRGIILRFINYALDHISANFDHPVGVNITLLIPNVMHQNLATQLVRAVTEELRTLQQKWKEKSANNKVEAFEVNTYSESDASFLYWMDQDEEINNGNYLAIDAGKGTIDFSILRIKNDHEVESLYRSGFIGSGNAISYAILDTFITGLLGTINEVPRQKLMYNLLFGKMADQAKLFDLAQSIEDYKKYVNSDVPPHIQQKHYKNLSEKLSVKEGDINDIDPLKIIEIINEYTAKKWSIGDPDRIIAGMIDRIVCQIIRHLKNADIEFDTVVMTGRGFMYKPLREELQRTINAVFGKEGKAKVYKYCLRDNGNIYDAELAKRSCLLGPLSTRSVNLKTNTVGLPIIREKKVQDQIDKECKNVEDIIIENTKPEQTPTSSDRYGKLQDMFSTVSSRIKNVIKKEDKDLFSYDTSRNQQNENKFLLTKDFFNTGMILNQFAYKESVIKVSGYKYILKDIPLEDSQYTIFFNGNEFVIRDKVGSYPLQYAQQQPDGYQQMVFESQFPKYNRHKHIRDKDVPVSTIEINVSEDKPIFDF